MASVSVRRADAVSAFQLRKAEVGGVVPESASVALCSPGEAELNQPRLVSLWLLTACSPAASAFPSSSGSGLFAGHVTAGIWNRRGRLAREKPGEPASQFFCDAGIEAPFEEADCFTARPTISKRCVEWGKWPDSSFDFNTFRSIPTQDHRTRTSSSTNGDAPCTARVPASTRAALRHTVWRSSDSRCSHGTTGGLRFTSTTCRHALSAD